MFTVSGRIGDICWPGAAAPERRDGLWRHTCFEAFVRLPESSSYVELNYSPSGEWAAYRFRGYREAMESLDVPTPGIRTLATETYVGIVTAIDLGGIEALSPKRPWLFNISAVIEASDGSRSHWALAHPSDVPDFHHPDCFVLEVPPAGEP